MKGVPGVRPGVALALALAAAVLLPGCFEPYRARVDPDVLTRELPWTETFRPDPGDDAYETEYRFSQGAGPPYPAILQVFSIRDSSRRSTEDLLEVTRRNVDDALRREGIEPDPATDNTTRQRTLRNGLETIWFTREGTVHSTGPLFQQNVRVLIIGEVGYDGRSSTSVVAVGIAQVGVQQCVPILDTCQTEAADVRSWVSMVGDERRSVRSAQSEHGLIDHLVTHG